MKMMHVMFLKLNENDVDNAFFCKKLNLVN